MIEIFCNGKIIRGFSSARIDKSLDVFSSTYSMDVFSTDEKHVPIFPGDEVEICLFGVPVIKGYNDSTETSFSQSGTSCRVSGTDKAIDCVDCPPEQCNYQNKKVDEIVRIVCAEFGLKFIGNEGAELGAPFEKFAMNPGATGYETIINACKERRVFPVHDGCGNVRIIGTKYARANDTIEQGVNILSARGSFSSRERFSSYKVISGSDVKCETFAEAIDDGVKRHRPWIEIDNKYSTIDNCSSRAMWEAKHRKAEANKINVTVDGCMQSNGKLWEPGTIASVKIPYIIGDDIAEMLINRVTYEFGQSGFVTHLSLVDVDTYAPMPTFVERKPVKKAKLPKAKKDIWASIRKQTGSKLGL